MSGQRTNCIAMNAMHLPARRYFKIANLIVDADFASKVRLDRTVASPYGTVVITRLEQVTSVTIGSDGSGLRKCEFGRSNDTIGSGTLTRVLLHFRHDGVPNLVEGYRRRVSDILRHRL